MTSRSGWACLDRARGELDDALVVPRARALLVLVGRDAEQQHAGMPSAAASPASRDGLRRSRGGRRRASPRSARGPSQAGLDEHRQDEVAGIQRASRARGRAGRACGAAGAGGSEERPREDGTPPVPAPRRLSAVRRSFASIAAKFRTAEGKLCVAENRPGASRMSRTRCSQLLGREFPLSSIRSPRGRRRAAGRARTARVVAHLRRGGLAALAVSRSGARRPGGRRPDRSGHPGTRLVPGLERAQARALPRWSTVLPVDRRRLRRARTARRSTGNAGADLTIGAAGKAKLVLAQEAASAPPSGPRRVHARPRRAHRRQRRTRLHRHASVRHGDGSRPTRPAAGGARSTPAARSAPCPSFAGALSGEVGPFLHLGAGGPRAAARLHRRRRHAAHA